MDAADPLRAARPDEAGEKGRAEPADDGYETSNSGEARAPPGAPPPAPPAPRAPPDYDALLRYPDPYRAYDPPAEEPYYYHKYPEPYDMTQHHVPQHAPPHAQHPREAYEVKRECEDPYSFVEEEAMSLMMGAPLHEPPPHLMHHQHQLMLNQPKKRGRKKKIKDENGLELKADGEPRVVKERKKHDRFNGMSEEEVARRTLPDHLAQNLDIIIIGINPGLFAAYKGHHYAGPGNHFWKCLYLSGLTREQMSADEDYKLLNFGIGFTNMVPRPTKGSADLTRREIKEGSAVLLEKLQTFRPKVAVFNGKLIYEVFSGKKDFCFGKQPDTIEGTNTYMWVMPSSSARCAQLPRAADKVPFYAALKKFRDFLNGLLPSLDEAELVFPDNTSRRPQEEMEIRRLTQEPEPGDTIILEDGTEVPLKKKRGRPKKVKLENGEIAPPTPRAPRAPRPPPTPGQPDQPAKKKRGRPKKIRPEDQQFLLQQQQQQQQQHQQQQQQHQQQQANPMLQSQMSGMQPLPHEGVAGTTNPGSGGTWGSGFTPGLYPAPNTPAAPDPTYFPPRDDTLRYSPGYASPRGHYASPRSAPYSPSAGSRGFPSPAPYPHQPSPHARFPQSPQYARSPAPPPAPPPPAPFPAPSPAYTPSPQHTPYSQHSSPAPAHTPYPEHYGNSGGGFSAELSSDIGAAISSPPPPSPRADFDPPAPSPIGGGSTDMHPGSNSNSSLGDYAKPAPADLSPAPAAFPPLYDGDQQPYPAHPAHPAHHPMHHSPAPPALDKDHYHYAQDQGGNVADSPRLDQQMQQHQQHPAMYPSNFNRATEEGAEGAGFRPPDNATSLHHAPGSPGEFGGAVKPKPQDVASKSLSGLESLVDQIPSIAEGEAPPPALEYAAPLYPAPYSGYTGYGNNYGAPFVPYGGGWGGQLMRPTPGYLADWQYGYAPAVPSGYAPYNAPYYNGYAPPTAHSQQPHYLSPPLLELHKGGEGSVPAVSAVPAVPSVPSVGFGGFC